MYPYRVGAKPTPPNAPSDPCGDFSIKEKKMAKNDVLKAYKRAVKETNPAQAKKRKKKQPNGSKVSSIATKKQKNMSGRDKAQAKAINTAELTAIRAKDYGKKAISKNTYVPNIDVKKPAVLEAKNKYSSATYGAYQTIQGVRSAVTKKKK